MLDITTLDWILVGLCAILVGFTKTGISNLGILVITVLMTLFPAKEAVGLQLPMLIVGDLFAVAYYRRNVVWKYLLSLLPWVVIGLAAGYALLDVVNNNELQPIIGALVLVLVVLRVVMDRYGEKVNAMLPESKIFSLFVGILAGFTTMIGNAAGGIMSIYLLVKHLPKKEFVGTGAWFYLFVNLIKLPLYIHLGLITSNSFDLDLIVIPAILIGLLLGVKILPRIPQQAFETIILIFTVVGGIKLLF